MATNITPIVFALCLVAFFASIHSEFTAAQIAPAVTSSDKNDALSAEASTKRLVPLISLKDDIEIANDQPLMATGIDLLGPPKRFPANQTPGHSEMRAQ